MVIDYPPLWLDTFQLLLSCYRIIRTPQTNEATELPSPDDKLLQDEQHHTCPASSCLQVQRDRDVWILLMCSMDVTKSPGIILLLVTSERGTTSYESFLKCVWEKWNKIKHADVPLPLYLLNAGDDKHSASSYHQRRRTAETWEVWEP